MTQAIGWEHFGRVMLAIKARGDVSAKQLDLIRQRCLKTYERTGVQSGAIAFVVLGSLENGGNVAPLLRLSDKKLIAKVRRGDSA